ncbi:MAG: hypothetical protein JJ916_04010 [Phycisphaerales bacterium]|nr:hypothetical protein [Phycisphaerales bacterium]
MTFYSPKQIDQSELEKAIKVILDAPAKGTDPKAALRSVLIRKCDHDQNARLDVPEFLSGLSKTLGCLMDEADRLGNCYTDGGFELTDNPGSLSLFRTHLEAGAGSNGGGCSSLPSSLAGLPPAIGRHMLTRWETVDRATRKALDRMRFDGEYTLAQALEEELADMNAIASENADAASNVLVVEQAIADSKAQPLVRLGNKGYETEFGGEL